MLKKEILTYAVVCLIDFLAPFHKNPVFQPVEPVGDSHRYDTNFTMFRFVFCS